MLVFKSLNYFGQSYFYERNVSKPGGQICMTCWLPSNLLFHSRKYMRERYAGLTQTSSNLGYNRLEINRFPKVRLLNFQVGLVA
jgi:hypothetical protein